MILQINLYLINF